MAFKTVRLIDGSAIELQEHDENHGLDLVSEASHTKSVGDAVYPTSSTAWAPAQANSEATIAQGIVINVPDANSFWVLTDPAFVLWTGHGKGAAETVLWLSQTTPSGIVGTKPAVGIRQRVGVSLGTNEIFWNTGIYYEVV